MLLRRRKRDKNGFSPPVLPYSVLLPERFSGCRRLAPSVLNSMSFSRATSILSPYPDLRAPESFTPSAGLAAISLRTSIAVL